MEKKSGENIEPFIFGDLFRGLSFYTAPTAHRQETESENM